MKRVGLVYGGQSAEREVSLLSAAAVRKYIDKKKYKVIPIEITPNPESIKKLINGAIKIDLALLVLHGPGGEDGRIQAVLDLLKVPYTSSGVLASAIAMNKHVTKQIVKHVGILHAKSHLLKHPLKLPHLKGKYVVKPNSIGSSLGISIVDNPKDLARAVKNAFKYDTQVLVEEFVPGREFTVPTLGSTDVIALPVIEIIPKKSRFFDYNSKYQIGGSDEIVPARINRRLTKLVQQMATKVHKQLGCRGLCRSDFILSEDGNFYFLEINTIPGMTETSLVPKSAKAAGMDFTQLIDKLISLA